MQLWDNHMHCNFSGDSETPPEEMIQSALKKGLAGITFTDHLDLDYPEDPNPFLLDLTAYDMSMRKICDDTRLPILHGIELGLQPHLSKQFDDIFAVHHFDYIIGSTHVVHGRDPYYPSYFEGRTTREAFTEYYEAILENLAAYARFDAIGHLDYGFRYALDKSDPDAADTYTPYHDLVDAILEKIIRCDIALEVNMGAFRCDLTHPNPSETILRRYRELGGRLLTIGADAHVPEHVGLRYDLLPEILRGCGFTEYVVYKDRVPHPHALL